MQYQGVNGVARKVVKRYQGVGGVARQVIKAYTGVNGVARLYYVSGTSWQKWAVQCELETYYKESEWEFYTNMPDGTNSATTGAESYTFDEFTGKFTLNGEKTIPKGGEGVVYMMLDGENTVFEVLVSKVVTIWSKTALGPYTRYICAREDTSYGAVMTPEGSYPDESKGFTYVTTFTENEIEYVVMLDPQTETYYCYNKI